jgi:hypothetical protein
LNNFLHVKLVAAANNGARNCDTPSVTVATTIYLQYPRHVSSLF